MKQPVERTAAICIIDAWPRLDDAPDTKYPTLCGRIVSLDDNLAQWVRLVTCPTCEAYLDDMDPEELEAAGYM